MTAHLLVTFLAQLGFWLFLRRYPAPSAAWLVCALAWVLLPLVFVPMLPVTHFLFEFSQRNWLWVYGILSLILWLACARRLYAFSHAGPKPLARKIPTIPLWCMGLFWLHLGFWCVLGLSISEFELGRRTPVLRDAVIYQLHWLSVQTGLGTLCLLAFRYTPSAPRVHGRYLRVAWALWGAAYLTLLWGGL